MDIISLIKTVTRSLIALIVVVGGLYMLSTGVSIPTEAWALAGIVIGGLFGVEAVANFIRSKQNQ